MINQLLDIIFSNYLFLFIGVILFGMFAVGLVKRLYKTAILILTIFLFYCTYLLLTNQPLPNIEEITDQITPSEETQEAIKDSFEGTEEELKKRFEKLNKEN
jgi:hypothetical protein